MRWLAWAIAIVGVGAGAMDWYQRSNDLEHPIYWTIIWVTAIFGLSIFGLSIFMIPLEGDEEDW